MAPLESVNLGPVPFISMSKRVEIAVLSWLSFIAPVGLLADDAQPDHTAPPDVAAPPADAEVTESGLASRVLEAGAGTERPGESSWVRVHYTGWTTDGEMFDSSIQRGKSLTLPLDKVIDGWTEGLGLMVEGEKRRLWIPEEMAYGGREGLPQGMLVFDVELLEIFELPEVPEHLTAPPADAEQHRKGLASKLLREGTGDRKPRSTSSVSVNYTGWTTDGEMFDSSLYRGAPSTFPLTGVIRGWTEGLQLMVEGEKRRFWIPEKLAYRGEEGKPKGMLIFDVELVEITTY